MKVVDRENMVWEALEKWEQSYFIESENNPYYSMEENFNQTLRSWRPDLQTKLLETVDSVIFHTHIIIQSSQYEEETALKLLDQGRVFNANIEDLGDMKSLTIDQLRFISNQHLARQRLLSLSQGSLAGIGGLFLVALDLPLMLTINLRSIQLVAMTYGYDLKKPYELMLVLKVFHVATLPKTMQKEGWHNLLQELDECEDEWLLFNDKNNYKSTVWLQQLIKQIGKGLILHLLRKKLIQGIPLFGIAIGATSNYFLTKQVSEIAHQFYQKRFLLEKGHERVI